MFYPFSATELPGDLGQVAPRASVSPMYLREMARTSFVKHLKMSG